MSKSAKLAQVLEAGFKNQIQDCSVSLGEVTITVAPEHLTAVCLTLRDDDAYGFEQLMDVCGVDYLHYGLEVEAGSDANTGESTWSGSRFAVVYHLLSLQHNWRLRLRVPVEGEPPLVDSVVDIWSSANWFEREAFDLYGIVFDGHPDLRRLLTDYGFIGHPFRKDFPVSGNVEMRYDPEQARVVYQPVSIEPRVGTARVIRNDFRYQSGEEANQEADNA
jgi:NADH-quinone oxidoreductase subunit C